MRTAPTRRRRRRPSPACDLAEQPEVDVDDAVAERARTGACRGPSRRRGPGRRRARRPAKRPWGLVTATGGRRSGRAGPGQAVQRVSFGHQIPAALPTRPRGSAARGEACRSGSTTMAWACPKPESNAGASATTWPRAASPHASPRGRGPRPRRPAHRHWSTCRSRVAGPCSAQRPARDGVGHGAAGAEQPGGELEQDLRLGVAAHRAEHRGAARRRGSPSPGTACAAAAGPGA